MLLFMGPRAQAFSFAPYEMATPIDTHTHTHTHTLFTDARRG